MGEGEEGEVEIRANQLISCTAPFSAFHSVSVNVKEGKEVQATDPCTAFHQRGALAQPCGHNTIVRDVGGGGQGHSHHFYPTPKPGMILASSLALHNVFQLSVLSEKPGNWTDFEKTGILASCTFSLEK